MRQLVTRLDDDVHERLKARAAAEGRSVNSLVAELVGRLVALPDGAGAKERLRRRAEAAGLLVVHRSRPTCSPGTRPWR